MSETLFTNCNVLDTGAGEADHGRPAVRRVDYVWVREASGVRVSDYRVVSGSPFALIARPGVDLSDHHPTSATLELCDRS